MFELLKSANGPQNISLLAFSGTDCVLGKLLITFFFLAPLNESAGLTVIATRLGLSEPLAVQSVQRLEVDSLFTSVSTPGQTETSGGRKTLACHLNFLRDRRSREASVPAPLGSTDVRLCVTAGEAGRSVGVFEKRLRPGVRDATSPWGQGETHQRYKESHKYFIHHNVHNDAESEKL